MEVTSSDVGLFAAILAVITGFLTYGLPKLIDYWNNRASKRADLQVKEFDDAVVRRKELIEEIHILRDELKKAQVKLEASEEKYWKLYQDHVELKAKYEDAVQELGRIEKKIDAEPPLTIS